MPATLIEEQLADLALSFGGSSLGAAGMHQTKRLLIDTLGCSLGGADSQPVNIGLAVVRDFSPVGPASVLWRGVRTSVDLAAFVNGIAIRYLDFNDTYTSRELGHPSDQIAALLATAEVAQSTGVQLLEAIALAYELFGRLADAVNVRASGFDYVTLQCISSAVAVGKLLGLSHSQLVNTTRLAAAANVALFQTRIGNVSEWKACAAGNASRNAVMAAQLAAHGMTGPSAVFEGRGGFAHAVARAPIQLEVAPRRERDLKIFAVDMKLYPVGHLAQTAVEAAFKARAEIRNPSDISHVEIRTFKTGIDIMAGDDAKWRPRNRETADHSMPFAVAQALLHGSLRAEHFDERHREAPEVLSLLGKISVAASRESEELWPEHMLTTLAIALSTGEHVQVASRSFRGDRHTPPTDDEVSTKFTNLATDRLSRSDADALLQKLWAFDKCADVSKLLSSLPEIRLART